MPVPNTKTGDAVTQTDKEKELQAKVEELTKREGNLLAVIDDPHIQKVIQARQAGTEVEIVAKDGAKAADTPTPSPFVDQKNIEDLSNKELADAMMKSMSDLVAQQLKPLTTSVSETQEFIKGARQQQIATDVQTCRSKYEDFQGMEEELADLSRSTGNSLRPEDLYLLKKARAGEAVKLTKPALLPGMESERPSHSVTRPTTKELRGDKGPRPVGRRGLQELVNDGMNIALEDPRK